MMLSLALLFMSVDVVNTHKGRQNARRIACRASRSSAAF